MGHGQVEPKGLFPCCQTLFLPSATSLFKYRLCFITILLIFLTCIMYKHLSFVQPPIPKSCSSIVPLSVGSQSSKAFALVFIALNRLGFPLPVSVISSRSKNTLRICSPLLYLLLDLSVGSPDLHCCPEKAKWYTSVNAILMLFSARK